MASKIEGTSKVASCGTTSCNCPDMVFTSEPTFLVVKIKNVDDIHISDLPRVQLLGAE